MEKFKNSLKSINKFGLAIVALMAITLMSFKMSESEPKRVDVLWGYDASLGAWVQLTSTSEYTCGGDQDICTRTYPDNKNPNDNPNDYTSQTPGTFIQ